MKALRSVSLAAALVASLATSSAFAGAIHDASLFTDNTLAANDDGSTGLVSLGFATNINGVTRSQAYVNNNGNITFTGPLSTFTPGAIQTGTFGPIIAPFFADVDTRGNGSGLTQYGQDTLDGRNVFGINWINVGYYGSHVDKLNSFQLILTDRSDIAAGDFDIQFNYDQIQWETGDASRGSGGLGGVSALAGYWTGASSNSTLAGSLVNGALLDGGPNALIRNRLNSDISGQYNFQVRNGVVVVNETPEPSALALVGLALAGLGLMSRKKRAG